MIQKAVIGLVAVLLVTGPVVASDKSEVMAPVHQFVDGFNKGDTKSAAAACTDEMSIIDEFAPHEWHGAGALSRWMADYEADAKKNGITNSVVTLSKPRHVDVTGDRAYVVVPTDYAFKVNGKPVKEHGSIMAISLQKVGSDWRITGWAWAKH
jgi:hypothetical protein